MARLEALTTWKRNRNELAFGTPSGWFGGLGVAPADHGGSSKQNPRFPPVVPMFWFMYRSTRRWALEMAQQLEAAKGELPEKKAVESEALDPGGIGGTRIATSCARREAPCDAAG